MPLVVVCLVPAAPVLLPWLTGDRVPEVEPVRAAVREATAELAGLGRVVAVTEASPGTLAGFGVRRPGRPSAGSAPAGACWPRELADVLLDAAALAAGLAPVPRAHLTWDEVTQGPAAEDLLATLDRAPVPTGLLLLADGSRTRGPRAPGGEDARGDVVDAELLAALRQGRPADVPDAAAVGATAEAAVRLLASVPGGPTRVLHGEAPLGVCHLVAVRRRDRTATGSVATRAVPDRARP